MQLESLQRKLFQLQASSGLEILFTPDGKPQINGATVKLQKGKIVKKIEFGCIDSFEKLNGKLSNADYLGVSITGRGVLTKTTDKSNLPPNPVEFVLPTSNPADFYCQITSNEELAYISIIRKSSLDAILDQLTGLNFKVLHVSIGGISDLLGLAALLTKIEGPIQTSSYLLNFSDSAEVDIKVLPPGDSPTAQKKEYLIGDQYISSSSLVAFVSACRLLIHGIADSNEDQIEFIQKSTSEFKSSRRLKAALMICLSSVLILLLINYFVYSHYFLKNQQLEASRPGIQSEMDKTSILGAEVRKKEALLNYLHWGNSSRLSYYADRVAAMMPGTLLLTDMKLFPVRQSDLSPETGMAFKHDTIEITGSCEDPADLTRFTENLRNVHEFQSVAIKNYLYKRENELGLFSLEIAIRD